MMDQVALISRRIAFIVLAATALGAVPLLGQGQQRNSGSADPAAEALKITEAVRLTGATRFEFDGALDDPIWQQVTFISDFKQKNPVEGAEPSERTEVAVVYDDGDLVIGARMFNSSPDSIAAPFARRDQDNGNAAMLIVSLDTYNDRRTAYSFAVTAAGVRMDWYHPSDHEFRRDWTFDPVWEAKTRIDAQGWTAEMRIPMSQLRFVEGQTRWGMNITRKIPNKNEEIYWVQIPKDETGWSSRFGALEGMGSVQPRKRMEVMPFVASDVKLTSSELVSDGNPFRSTRETTARVGADFKMGLGPNLTLDATVLPDFGQVDADPAEVNLTQFETIFPERRPFFTEGNQLLRGQGNVPSYYNSRRIGAPPSGSVNGDYTNVPNTSTILGAAKLTGRMQSGLSIGALAAMTQREFGDSVASAGNVGQREVEPLTFYGITRLQQEFGPDASTVGLTLTNVSRNFSSLEMRELLPTQAITGGSDMQLRFAGGKYELRGHVGLSYVRGDSNSIARLQNSSARYYQRPDQDYVALDSTRTDLLGYSFSLQASKNSGRHWLWSGGVWADSPGLELNDIGVLRRADDIQSWLWLSYRENEPGKVFRNYQFWFNPNMGFNFGGIKRNNGIWGGGSWTFNNYMWNNVTLAYHPKTLNDQLTRGGPLMGDDGGWRAFASWGNNRSANTTWSIDGGITDVNYNSTWNLNLRLGFQPSDRFQFSVSPGYFHSSNQRQYLTTQETSFGNTFGNRYIFSTIDFNQISAQFRLNYLFTPDLSLELYAEPFAASGSYSGFGELPVARSSNLRLYGTDGTTIVDNPDPEEGGYLVTDGTESFTLPNNNFNTRSFRSNLVLRWEWSPGSTLFLVWQQNKSAFEDNGERVRTSSVFDAFTAPGQNVIAIKASYWIPVR